MCGAILGMSVSNCTHLPSDFSAFAKEQTCAHNIWPPLWDHHMHKFWQCLRRKMFCPKKCTGNSIW